MKRIFVLISFFLILGLQVTSSAEITPVVDRTTQVRDAIVAAASVNSASDVTETQLAAITSLNLRSKGITALKSGDFSGMTGLTSLNLYNNELSSLPDGIFEGLTALSSLRLGGNTVDPMPITVLLEEVGEDQIKAIAPTGAPFDIVLPISVTNGSLSEDVTSLTISKGSTESNLVTVSRTTGTTAAVTANIGTLSSVPNNHYGYALSKSDTLPLEVIGVITSVDGEDESTEETETTETPTNTAPTFTDGNITVRSVSENTAIDVNIGRAVSATDTENDTLIYSLGGVDADAFNIVSTTGQLITKVSLDYETKRIYSVNVNVSDGNLTDSITVIISIIDIDDTPSVSTMLAVSERTPEVRDAIVATIPNVNIAADVTDDHLATIISLDLRRTGITQLKTGDFSGLTGLTNLNLYDNMLESLPVGIFEGLTSLTTFRLGGNLTDPMPLIVSLQQVAADQFQAIVHTGAPFNVVLPIEVTNGITSNGETTITIPQGSLKSDAFTVVSTSTSEAIGVSIGTLPSLPANHYGYILARSAVCSRTSQVADAIAAAVSGASDCNNVTDVDLATITSLDLSNMDITSLRTDDFSGLLSLSTLNLLNNLLDSLPDGIFDSLTSLTSLNLSGNTVDPFPLGIALEKVGEAQFKAGILTGAPFDIILPITVANGSLSGNATTITILQGNRESMAVSVVRTPKTFGAVTVNLDALPSLPTTQTGYTLVRSNQVPLEILPALNVAPEFIDGEMTTRSIAERTVADVNIGSPVSATDGDGDTLTYNLSGTDAESFNFDSTTGQLKTKSELDYEERISYTVTITVSDGVLTDTITVTINITDINDNRRPEFTEGDSATRIIAENTNAGVDIGSAVSATDPDEDTLTYSLLGTDASVFDIDSSTGQLQTKASLDYETKSSYSVTVDVSDGEFSDSIAVTINIADIDETTADVNDDTPNNAPVFTDGESTTRSVAENTGSGVDIGNPISATDEDKDTLSYSLGGTDALSFSISSVNGQLRTNAALNYETKSSYSVTITVSDGNEGSATISVTINITDVLEKTNTTPQFTDGSTTSRSVAENTGSGVDIGDVVSATDDDDDTLTYSLSGTDASSFSIDSRSGQLRTSASLDYETKSSYTVTMTVSDGNGGSASITITINITDVDETTNTAPVFTDGSSTSRSVDENTGSGVDIGSAVSATDADDDTLSYSLSGTDGSSFSIDSSSGQLRTSASLDYETKSSYSVTITVSDGEGGSASITVTININDIDESPANNAPVFTDGSSTTRAIAENTASNVNVGSPVSATDADDDTLSYSLSGTDATSFSIDSTTGQLKTSASLNFETKNSYVVTVTASDNQGGSANINVTINVTNVNEAPVFTAGTSTTRSIAENAGPNINIGSVVSATDVDSTTLTYTLGGTNGALFDIESTTGQLKTKAALDYETKTSYSVTITVSDGSLTDSIAVTINVRDLDETPSNVAPVFTDGDDTIRTIAENTAADANIGNAIAATDEDSENIAYLLSGTDASSFAIDGTTGQLKTNAALDYETKTSYEVIVTVSDGTLEDEITVTISVTNVNEAPVFTDGDSITRQVAENTVAATNLGNVITATDPDANDTITYSLSGADAAAFDIGSTSGQLQTEAALDYETKNSYTVTVTATDTGDAADTITVTITVADVNEAPAFDGESAERSIAENTGSGVNIGDAVSATDPDTDDMLEYSLGGTDAASFDIGSTNGQLRTKAALDYETKASYSVTVSVTDGNGGTDSIAVTINITDVNENRAPVFASESTTRSIAENTGSGVNIGDAVSATDPDTDDTLEYSLGGTDATSFDIGSTNGQLRTKAALDYETKASYSVTVSVSDGNGGTDSIAVTINVTDVPENRAPAFSTDSASRSVAENTGSGVNISIAITATDPDSSDTLEYSLGGTDASSFSIDSTSGQLRTNAALNYEIKNSYSVTVSVSDGNGGTDSIAVTINITDVNEAPTFTENSPTTRSIAENTASDTNIGSAVSATDPDSGDSLTYGLGGTDAASFSIDSSSGQLKTKVSLDREDDDAYEITVIVSDDDNLSTSITVNISITDVNEAPSFTEASPTTRSIAENTASGQNIGAAVSATDPEGDTLEYTLEGTDASSFSIVSTSGQLQTNAALDYETKTSYSVTVKVTDDTFTDTIAVTINVTDVNENTAPSFSESSFSYRISDIANASVGDNIGDKVTATDADEDTLSYSLGGDDAAKFDIDSSSGQIKVTQALIDDTNSSYSIKVIATDPDNATAEISGTIFVTRVLQQVTNNAPVFADDSTTLSVAENTASGENIGSPITATDGDAGDTLTYSLEGTDAASFSIVSTSGQLQTSAALDYETKNSYSVTVKVTDDSGASNNSDTIAVTVSVTDVNEGITPVANRTPAIRDAIVAEVHGVDDAEDVTAEHLKTIKSLDLSSKGLTSLKSGDFDGLTELISVWLNRNMLSSLPSDIFKDNTSLEVILLNFNRFTSLPDGLLSGLTSLILFSVHNNPIDPIPFTVTVEKVESGKMKVKIPIGIPFDVIIPINITNGSFSGGTTNIIVYAGNVESETGFVTRTEGTTEAVTVDIGTLPDLPDSDGIYFDGFSLQKSSDLPITVIEAGVTPISDNDAPTFTDGSSTIRSVPENSDINTNIGTPVSATDGDDDTLSYSFFGDDTRFFTIDTTSGQLKTNTELNYERRNSFSFLMIVRDGNGGSDTIDVIINVSDVDENDPFAPLDDRSPIVADAILAAIPDASSYADVTLDQLTAITELNLQGTRLSSLQVNDFHKLTGLTKIDLTWNHFTTLPSGLFDGLTSLTNLDMGLGRLTSLPAGIFDPLTSLKSLSLFWNKLTSLPSGVFDELTSLEDLYINVNHLTTLPSGIFDELTVLKTLGMSSNPLTAFSDSVFDKLSSLETLGVGDLSISTYPSDIFDELTSLKTLDLSYSELTSLPDGIFDELASLTKLDLSENDFTSLTDGMFDGLTSLSILDISRNQINTLDGDFFDDLTTLTELHLDRNDLTSLPDGIFDELTSLTLLDFSANDITSLSGTVFQSLSSLRTLNFWGNSLTSLPDGIFKNLTSLNGLNIPGQADGANISVSVSLVKVDEAKFKVIVPTAAPFTMTVLLYILNGEVDGDYEASTTVNKGSIESETLTAVRGDEDDPDIVVAVFIDAVRGKPSWHLGYSLTYDSNQTLVVIDAAGAAPESNQNLPEETAFLPNYPNPFNPETWIPYQLSKVSDVTLTIYDMCGVVVRELALGLQPTGYYTDRKRAAYWDGRNGLGEKVAAGIYFCKFKAGDYTATRKLLIRK